MFSNVTAKSLLLKTFTVTSVFVSRLGALPANFSPVGSYGFFSSSPVGLIITVLAFDLLKGGFYKGFLWTYLGFSMYYLLGRLTKDSTKRKLVLLPAASLSFFALSNIGVWLNWYPQTLEGLLACFTAALPFYRNTVLADLVFGYGFIFAPHLAVAFRHKIHQTESLLQTSI